MDRIVLLKALQKVGHFMGSNNLAWGTAGNISARLSEDNFYVTASGTNLDELELEDFSLCNKDGLVEGKKPSKEYIFHQGIYEKRSDINAILHSSPFYSTLIASSNIELPSNYLVEAMYYLEKVVHVPYYHPGSLELASAIKEKSLEGNILLLKNHGVVVYDKSIKEAKMALETLEYISKMYITALEKGIEVEGLPKETVKDFLENSGYKPLRQWTFEN